MICDGLMISDCLDNGLGTLICSADKCVARMIEFVLLLITFHFLKFVIVVVDSTDRERISVTKEELYKMLAHEVSRPCVFFGLIFIVGKVFQLWVVLDQSCHLPARGKIRAVFLLVYCQAPSKAVN